MDNVCNRRLFSFPAKVEMAEEQEYLKFSIVAEIVSLLKKIYKRDAPFRAVFKVKTLAVMFSAYPREVKHILRNLNPPPFWRCLFLWK